MCYEWTLMCLLLDLAGSVQVSFYNSLDQTSQTSIHSYQLLDHRSLKVWAGNDLELKQSYLYPMVGLFRLFVHHSKHFALVRTRHYQLDK